MKFVPLLYTTIIAATAGLALACDNEENPVPRGDPIPDTSIVSCGDDLLGQAPPTGTFNNGTLTVGESGTTFAAEMIWQASCPGKETDPAAQTEYDIDEIALNEDDAGYPGAEIAISPVTLGAVVTCEGAAPGISETEEIDPVEVTDLGELCEEYLSQPTGSPLYVHVALIGIAVTCSNEEFPLEIIRKVSVDCPELQE